MNQCLDTVQKQNGDHIATRSTMYYTIIETDAPLSREAIEDLKKHGKVTEQPNSRSAVHHLVDRLYRLERFSEANSYLEILLRNPSNINQFEPPL